MKFTLLLLVGMLAGCHNEWDNVSIPTQTLQNKNDFVASNNITIKYCFNSLYKEKNVVKNFSHMCRGTMNKSSVAFACDTANCWWNF